MAKINRRILALHGSPRANGNSSQLLNAFLRGADENAAQTETIFAHQLKLNHCRGCLRCNLVKRCVLRNDDWEELSQKILAADVLVFSTPIYFHHVPAPLKTIIDRFRSFIHVQILEDGLRHTPWQQWAKKIVLMMSLGSPQEDDALPVINLFQFICQEMGSTNQLSWLVGTRLAVANQIIMDEIQLAGLYEKLKIPIKLAAADHRRNQQLLEQCYNLGKQCALVE